MSDSFYTTLKTTAISHIRAFESTSGPTGNPFDPANIYTYRTPTCPMRFHPGSSMPTPFNGPITRVEHEPALLMLGALMASATSDIHEVTVDVATRVVAVRHTINYVFKGVKGDPGLMEYAIAYVWFTEMDESGERIVRMEECLDTTRAGVMIERAMKFAEENSG